MKLKHLILMSSSIIAASCSNTSEKPDGNAHYSPSEFDSTTTVGDDFYQFTNGGWMKSHPIPGEKSRLNTFDVLNDENLDRLKEIVENAQISDAEEGTNLQKIGDYYALAMDSSQREQLGIKPLNPILEEVKSMTFNLKDPNFAKIIAYHHLHLGNPFFAVGCTPDAKNSSMNIAELWQDGINLPNRDYYFDESEKGKEIIVAYKQMIANYLRLMEVSDYVRRSEKIYEFEKEMASLMNTKVENRDPQKTYNKMTYDEMKAKYSSFEWDAYFAQFPVKPKEITVGQPRFFESLFPLIERTDSVTLSDYMLFSTVNSVASYLSDDYAMNKFEFYSKKLNGVTERKPQWKRALDMVQSRLGQPLGQLFVERYFPESAKNRMLSLVEALRTAFGQRIDNLTWMSDSTKQQAKTKLAAINVKIGYPDVWEDFSEAQVDRNLSLVENFINLTYFHSMKGMKEVNQPVDRNKWYMTPQTVNAYYSPLNNEIVFPAGILQPPFFYADGDDAVNFGAIGVVIGHEMTHGFDDSGRQFDKDGNLQDWWTADDALRFKSVTEKLKNRFSQVVVIDSMKCNGELTLGENIADLGGLNIAYQAFLNTNRSDALIDEQTPSQRFLLAYSRIWAGNYRDEYLRQQVITDPHANGKYRVNVQLPMLDFFYTAFDITEQYSMYVPKEDRIVIW